MEDRYIFAAEKPSRRGASGQSEHVEDVAFGQALLPQFGDTGAAQRLYAICAEPGMGLHQVSFELASFVKARGYSCHTKEMSGFSPDYSARVLSRSVHEIDEPADRHVFLFIDIQPSDESCVARQARGIQKLIDAGAIVILAIVPEARQLLECLPGCHVTWSSDLVSMQRDRLKGAGHFAELGVRTRYIPSLVLPLRSFPFDRKSQSLPQSYYEALGKLVGLSVRRSLSDEELRVRLCMLLLGRGSADDLTGSIVRSPHEIMAELWSVAPLFGVSSDLSTFECLCCEEERVLVSTFPRLRALGALFPDVLEVVEQLLVNRGSLDRCATLLRVFGVGERPWVFESYVPAFLDSGQIALARRIVDGCAAAGHRLANQDQLEAAIEALAAKDLTRTSQVPAGDCEDALALIDARRILRACPPALKEAGLSASSLLSDLRVHRAACDFMISGRNGEALRLLASSACESTLRTVSGSLLALDLEMARLLVCDGEDDCGGVVGQAEEFLSQPALVGLSSYVSMVEVVRHALQGDVGASVEAATLASRAERRGDVVPQVVGLIAGSLCDLRSGALTRASIKAALAKDAAKRRSLDYLARVASLFKEVARYLLGERAVADNVDGPRDDLALVRSLVREAMGLDDGVLPDSETYVEVPRDALWLVGSLACGVGEFSSLLSERMPASWRRAVEASASGASRAHSEGPAELLETTADGMGGPEVPIEVRLLGGFSVCVRGVRVPDWKLEQRGAKSMLEYLILRGGVAKRYQLVEQIWPDCDYTSGFNHAYQATSVLRSSIGEIEPGLDPFVAGRASREVALDMSLVNSDVERFRAAAREASDNVDHVRALEMARRAERIYVGDLYLPVSDATGYVASVQNELRELYADAMVAGGDAALALGRERTAVRLASNALSANDLREDAVIVLIKALRASGRAAEADQQYRRYSGRLLRAGGHACPSSRLRQLMGEVPGASSPEPSPQ